MFKTLIIFLCLSTSYAFDINKDEVQSMMEQMKSSGLLSDAQLQDAQKKLKNMDEKDWEAIQKKGRSLASKYQEKNGDVSNTVDSAANNIDFDSEQFKDIQSKVKEAMGDK